MENAIKTNRAIGLGKRRIGENGPRFQRRLRDSAGSMEREPDPTMASSFAREHLLNRLAGRGNRKRFFAAVYETF